MAGVSTKLNITFPSTSGPLIANIMDNICAPQENSVQAVGAMEKYESTLMVIHPKVEGN